MTTLDEPMLCLERAIRTILGRPVAVRPAPRPTDPAAVLTAAERRHAAALMRVNHVGEVCAQALYEGQALGARSPAVRAQLRQAAREETDHLAWTRARLDALGGRPSRLNPLWYGAAMALGVAAGLAGDAVSLGLVVETERQVESHLRRHLEALPAADAASRAVVAGMIDDEARHGAAAQAAGAAPLPRPVPALMRAAARLMTTTAYRI